MSAPNSDSGISAIILAAGMSKRMGASKQLLRLGGATLLEHALNNVRQSHVQGILLVLGHEADSIQKQVRLDGVKVVVNPGYQQGMGTSLRAGIAALAPDARGALIVLADQPYVRPATIDRLIEKHRALRPQIVIPLYRGFRGNPVLLDRSVFPELAGLAGDVGCRAIFGDHTESILKVEVEDVGILLDADSEQDFEKLRKGAIPEKPILESAEGLRAAGDDERPGVVIVGRERFAHALAAMARLLRFTVTIVDPLLAPAEFPEADYVLHELDFSKLPAASDRYVAVASSGQFDEEAIEQALAADAAYVALKANRKRGEEITRSLQSKGLPSEKLARLRVPAGLEIGAESQEEIALSVMAEIVAARAARKGTEKKQTLLP